MADQKHWQSRAAFYAQKYGVDPRIFNAQIRQESGYDPNAVSHAGAIGIAQIVPRWHPGVNPRNPEASLNYAARWMSQLHNKYGNYRDALSVYNSGRPWQEGQDISETRNYVAKIIGSLDEKPKVAGGGAHAPGVARSTSMGGGFDREEMRKAVAQKFLNAAQSGGVWTPGSLLELAGMRQQGMAAEKEFGPVKQTAFTPAGGDWTKWVGKPAPRQGPSAPHTQSILQFVGQVGRTAGTKLTPWGNESHSITTVNGNRSAHADGNAADIPAVGEELIRLGRAALVAAGADPKWANKQKGGLFNIGGKHIIFNTDIGGNHHDHVHVGLRG